jgi:hypothetical protein
MDNQQWIRDLEGTGFLHDLLDTLVQRGLGVLPAREVAISTLEMILRHHPEWSTAQPPDYELARLLRISPRRLRGYLDDINFRNQAIDSDELNQRLRALLSRAERIREGEWVAFAIEDALLRSYAQQRVRENFGIFETGITGSVIRISGEQFVKLSLSVLSEEESKAILAALDREQVASSKQNGAEKKLRVRLWEAFALSASKQAGKKVVELGFLLASGGLSEVASISDAVGALLGVGGDSDGDSRFV